MATRRLRPSQSGVSAVVGSILLIGIVVVMTVAAGLLYNRLAPHSTTPVDSGARAAFTTAGYQVTLAGPDNIPVDSSAKLVVTRDGVEQTLPLSAIASQLPDPSVWKVGDSVCLVGPAPCPIPSGTAVGVRVISQGQVVFDLPPLQYAVAGPTFLLRPNGGIAVQCVVPSVMKVIGQQFTYNGGDPPVTVAISTSGSGPFTMLFGGADVSGGEIYDLHSVSAGSVLGIQSTVTAQGFTRTYDSYSPYDTTQWNDASLGPHVYTLKNGDQAPPDLPPVSGQTSLTAFMGPYVNADGTMHLATNEVIMLFEFWQLGTSGADFQDLVVLFQFDIAMC
jgi:hypothetical protein